MSESTTTAAEDTMTTPGPESTTTMVESSSTTDAPGEAQETTTTEATTTATDETQMTTTTESETETPTETPTASSSTEVTEATTTADGNAPDATNCSVAEGATLTISEQTQTTELAGCKTFSGSLAVATDYVGQLLLDDIDEITGDLCAIGVEGISTLSGDALAVIGGQLHLEDLSALEKVTFGDLTTVQTLNLTSIGAPSGAGNVGNDPGVSFDLGSLETVTDFFIYDTTMKHMDGINLVTVKVLTIMNNPELTSIELSHLTKAESIWVSGNGVGSADVEFNALASVGESIHISEAQTVSLQVLTDGSVTLNNNTFTTLSLPDLTTVTQFELNNNTELTEILVPSLVTIGGTGVNITDNNNLNDTISFQALKSLAGGTFEGNYEAVEFPNLFSISGDLVFQSSKNIKATCTQFEADTKGSPYHVDCTYPGSSGSSDKGATIGGSVGGVVGFFIVVGVAVVGGYFWWMRRKGGGSRGGNGRTFGDHGFELANQRRRNYQSGF